MALLQYLLQYLLLVLFLLPVVLCAENSTELCAPEDMEDCNCFSYLTEQIRQNDKNLFEIQKIFYPPNAISPAFVVVVYHFGDITNNINTEVWFWTTSTFYIWQPLPVFQFTSLFFSDTTSRSSEVNLTLPFKCNGIGNEYMQLLTQRLHIYALSMPPATSIANAYEAKAEKVETLAEWYREHTYYSAYVVFNFFMFPVISWLILLFIFWYLISSGPEARMENIKASLESYNCKKIDEVKFRLQNEFTMSLIFVMFSFSLSSAAFVFSINKTDSMLHSEVRKYFSFNVNGDFSRIYSLAIVVFLQDLTVAVLGSFIMLISAISHYVDKKEKSNEVPEKILKKSAEGLISTVEGLVAVSDEHSSSLCSEAKKLHEAAKKISTTLASTQDTAPQTRETNLDEAKNCLMETGLNTYQASRILQNFKFLLNAANKKIDQEWFISDKCLFLLIAALTDLTMAATHLATTRSLQAATKLTTAATEITKATFKMRKEPPGRFKGQMDAVCEACNDKLLPDECGACTKQDLFPEARLPWWSFCAYSPFFPLCCVLNHLNYIIIAFIHDLYHATSVAIVYGIIIVFYYVVLDRLPYVLKSCREYWLKLEEDYSEKENCCCKAFFNFLKCTRLCSCCCCCNRILAIQFWKIAVLLFLIGYVAVDIIVYFYIPIENAFEDAANHFISIYQTTIVFFTALVVFFIIQQPSRSQINIFSKALDKLFYKHNKQRMLDIKKNEWALLGNTEKDIEVARSLLKKIE